MSILIIIKLCHDTTLTVEFRYIYFLHKTFLYKQKKNFEKSQHHLACGDRDVVLCGPGVFVPSHVCKYVIFTSLFRNNECFESELSTIQVKLKQRQIWKSFD